MTSNHRKRWLAKLLMVKYPLKLKRDTNGSLLVGFRDVPEAHTFGENEGEALKRAVDALETALIPCMEEKRDIPQPTHPKKGEKVVVLPALSEAKITPCQAMRDARVRKSELDRRQSRNPRSATSGHPASGKLRRS